MDLDKNKYENCVNLVEDIYSVLEKGESNAEAVWACILAAQFTIENTVEDIEGKKYVNKLEDIAIEKAIQRNKRYIDNEKEINYRNIFVDLLKLLIEASTVCSFLNLEEKEDNYVFRNSRN